MLDTPEITPKPPVPAQQDTTGHNGTQPENNSHLTPRQWSALPFLAATPNIRLAARVVGIGKSTLYRWLEDPGFRDELTRLRRETADLARIELQGLMLRSVSVLAESMEHDDQALRLRAARYALTFGLQAAEADRLRGEIQNIQEALSLQQTTSPL